MTPVRLDEINYHQSRIVGAVQEVTTRLLPEPKVGNKIWTESIKTTLAIVGTELRIHSYAHGIKEPANRDWHEWLWDFVWARQKAIDGSHYQMVTELPMIAEIEWNTSNSEIVLDFQKLVFGLADLKLYIFTKGSEAENQRVLELCKSLCQTHSETKVGKYLIIGVPGYGSPATLFVRDW